MNEEIGFTVKENDLLNRMAAGELDGFVCYDLVVPKAITFWVAIVGGIPARYVELPTTKEIVDGTIQRALGNSINISEWRTEEEKLEFLKEYGNRIADDDVKAYAVGDKPPVTKRKMIIDWNVDNLIFHLGTWCPVQ